MKDDFYGKAYTKISHYEYIQIYNLFERYINFAKDKPTKNLRDYEPLIGSLFSGDMFNQWIKPNKSEINKNGETKYGIDKNLYSHGGEL